MIREAMKTLCAGCSSVGEMVENSWEICSSRIKYVRVVM
jgi:hypothetical protein